MQGFGSSGGDASFFKQQAQRRVAAAKPMGGLGSPRPPARPMGGGFVPPGRPPMPGPMPGPRPPMPPAPPGGPMGGPAWSPRNLDGPSAHMFMGLPAGTEEAFGFAPKGFNNSLRGGGMF